MDVKPHECVDQVFGFTDDECALVAVFRDHGLNGTTALHEMAAQCLDVLGARGWKVVEGYSTLGP